MVLLVVVLVVLLVVVLVLLLMVVLVVLLVVVLVVLLVVVLVVQLNGSSGTHRQLWEVLNMSTCICGHHIYHT